MDLRICGGFRWIWVIVVELGGFWCMLVHLGAFLDDLESAARAKMNDVFSFSFSASAS